MLSRRDFLKGLGSLPIVTLAQLPLSRFLWGQDQNWGALQQQIASTGSQLSLPGDAAYLSAKQIFNLRLNPSPAAILTGSSEDAIQKAIAWAAQNNVNVYGRSGGHSYEGFSMGPGLVVDTRGFNTINVDSDAQTATIGAGSLLGRVIHTLSDGTSNNGFAIPTGSCGTVGVAGLTLGGGMGLSSRMWGLTCDNLNSVRIITADGNIQNVSSTQNADLFWALRGGGGGNYGVVTSFEFNLHRALDVVTFTMAWPGSQFERVFTNWQQQIQNTQSQNGLNPRQVTSIFKINANSSGITDVRIVGQVLSGDGQNAPTTSDARALIQPYAVGNPSASHLNPMTFVKAAEFFAGGTHFPEDDPPVRFKAKSSYCMEALDSNAMSTIRSALANNIPSGAGVCLMCDSYGGAIADVAADATAFAHRNALYCMQYYVQWGNSSSDTSMLNMMNALYTQINPNFSGACYPNYCDSDLPNPLAAYYGDNLARLQSIKKTVDPSGLFKNSIQNL